MFGIGWTEILVILVVALLCLGPKRLPEIAKGLGRGLRDFRRALSGLDLDEPLDAGPKKNPPPEMALRQPLPDEPPVHYPIKSPETPESPVQQEASEKSEQ